MAAPGRYRSFFLAFVVAAALLAGCTTSSSGEGQGESTEAATGSEDGTTGAATTPPPSTEPEVPEGPALRVNLGPEPTSLDPDQAVDPAAMNVVAAIFDPLVRLSPDGSLVPALAQRWKWTNEGLTLTFRLRSDGVWTNGDPVTAADFEYSWKRALSPQRESANAAQLLGIVGAEAYNACDAENQDCAALREAVAIDAVDDVTLEVRLTRRQPWFVYRVADPTFLPVHEPTVREFRGRWANPANIVTNGPFRLAARAQGTSLTLERWDQWRDADAVQLAVVEASVLPDADAGLAAFEGGELDACLSSQCVPEADAQRVGSLPAYTASPALEGFYLGVRMDRVTDADQRKAIALALGRTALVNEALPAQAPASSLTPAGMPGFNVIETNFVKPKSRAGKAERLQQSAEDPLSRLRLTYPAGEDAIAEAIQGQLAVKLGLDVRLREHPADSRAVTNGDLYLLRIRADVADAIAFLGLWTCDGALNRSGFCSSEYDALVDASRLEEDDGARYDLYAQLEAALTSKNGAFPLIPIAWGMIGTLAVEGVEGLEPNSLGLYDFAAVTMPASP